MSAKGGHVDRATWALILAIGVADAALCLWLGFAVTWASALPTLAATVGLVLLGLFYTRVRPDERIAAAVTGVAQLVAFSSLGAVLSYVAASLGGPFWDATLHAADRALGLDWRAYLAFVNDRPWLGVAFTVAYQSLIPQTIVAAAALGLSGRIVEARVFAFAFVLSGLACILISAAMPAMAMFVHLGLGPEDFPNLKPAAAFVHAAAMDGLRDGSLRTISLSEAEGIITFPSYHSALGVIFIAAFWPFARLRWAALALNLLLIAATPIDGGHYFVDLLAGMAIAALALAAGWALASRRAREPAAVLRLAPGH